jgi:hypothetical protein
LAVIEVPETDVVTVQLGILGHTPYIHNRLAEKARQELLYPKGRKTQADKAANLKHDPFAEFRSSPYKLSDPDAPTLLATMGAMFKGAMRTAALDLPGVKGTQIDRLVWVDGHHLPFWGGAELHMAVTRTPDIRTRCISPQWATIITVSFVRPLINEKTIANLLSTGGRSAGVGDWRTQKGKGTFGQFDIVSVDELKEMDVMKQDRSFQIAAMEAAHPHDAEAEELLTWFVSERETRGQ